MRTWLIRGRRTVLALASTAGVLLAATGLTGQAAATTQIGPVTVDVQERIVLPEPSRTARIVWEITFQCNDVPAGTLVEIVGGVNLFQIRGDDHRYVFGWGESGYCEGQDTLVLRAFVDSFADPQGPPHEGLLPMRPGRAMAYADITVSLPEGSDTWGWGGYVKEPVLLVPQTP